MSAEPDPRAGYEAFLADIITAALRFGFRQALLRLARDMKLKSALYSVKRPDPMADAADPGTMALQHRRPIPLSATGTPLARAPCLTKSADVLRFVNRHNVTLAKASCMHHRCPEAVKLGPALPLRLGQHSSR